MKTLNETFTDKEFRELEKAKFKLKNGNKLNWRMFFLRIVRDINGEDARGKR